ncbi:hypothetical protein [Bifidobacterium callimiconis]|uniref:hypothetical protein n=1 Tax=Bifidobacterium callimiconis TaxID=2306973 RepID=UPI001BDD2402|nr:hypothetical protein [Bifidobacterium callimiconis]
MARNMSTNDMTSVSSSTIVTDDDRTAVRRMRITMLVWLAIFAAILSCTIAAGLDTSGGPAEGTPIMATVTSVNTRDRIITVAANGEESTLRHLRHSPYAYRVGQRINAFLFEGEIHETLNGVSNTTPLRRAYPWLALGTLAVGIVTLTYAIGWRRATRLIREAEAGDPVSAAFLQHGPQLGTVDWWWTSLPVRPHMERRHIRAFGVILLVLAVGIMISEIRLWRSPLMAEFGMAMALSCIPLIAIGIWCLSFARHPTEHRIVVLGRLQWVLLVVGLISLAFVWMTSSDVYEAGAIVAMYGFALNYARGIRMLSYAALPGDVVIPHERERIDADLERMARSEPQIPMDELGMRKVRTKRERRMMVRYALLSALFLLILIAFVVLKLTLG